MQECACICAAVAKGFFLGRRAWIKCVCFFSLIQRYTSKSWSVFVCGNDDGIPGANGTQFLPRFWNHGLAWVRYSGTPPPPKKTKTKCIRICFFLIYFKQTVVQVIKTLLNIFFIIKMRNILNTSLKSNRSQPAIQLTTTSLMLWNWKLKPVWCVSIHIPCEGQAASTHRLR